MSKPRQNLPQARLARRKFVKASALGAAAAVVVPALIAPNQAQAFGRSRMSRERVDNDLVPHINAISLDTFAGVGAFVAPGNDAYSIAQGVSTPEPGGLASRTDIFLVAAFNNFLPNLQILRWAVDEMMRDMQGIPMAVPANLAGKLSRDEQQVFSNMGDGVNELLEANGTIPLAIVFAVLLNILSVTVNPASRNGTAFRTPFARLSFQEKARVFEQLETTVPELLSPDSTKSILPIISTIKTLLATLSGLIDFASGAMLEFAAFGAYSEISAFDPVTRTLKGRPAGWTLSNYQPEGQTEGWDEFQGYFQGRREVSND